jgi:L-threonylcarbamoyladenylate synthase
VSVVPISLVAPDPGILGHATDLLRSGQLVAFPTETVYGLGGNALDPEAVTRIFEAKGRPSYNPLIVHVPDADAARLLVTRWPEAAEQLARRWWPGPLTLVLPKAAMIPVEVTAGLATVALRVPAHPVAHALLERAGVPLAAPSANRSGEVSPTTAMHVQQSLGDRVPLILDAGPTAVGIESTVVDLSGARPVLLRPGMISREALSQIIGPVDLAGASADAESARPSPGMLDRHYAPRARLVLYADPADARVRAALAEAATGGRPSALLHWSSRTVPTDLAERLPSDPDGYARALYGALHQMDDQSASVILVEQPPAGSAWDAIRDRLERAARP